jgi:hypothetical protein
MLASESEDDNSGCCVIWRPACINVSRPGLFDSSSAFLTKPYHRTCGSNEHFNFGMTHYKAYVLYACSPHGVQKSLGRLFFLSSLWLFFLPLR